MFIEIKPEMAEEIVIEILKKTYKDVVQFPTWHEEDKKHNRKLEKACNNLLKHSMTPEQSSKWKVEKAHIERYVDGR